MAIPDQPATTEAARAERQPSHLSPPRALATTGPVAARLGQAMVVERVSAAAWRLVHPLGMHRWRDGYETDVELGWTQYRGSRCTVCDAPWEGW